MTEYSIYKIVSGNTDKCYIGSTTKSLEKRLGQHKNCFRMFEKGFSKKYYTSFEILKAGDCEIVLLCNCKNRDDAATLEGQAIRNHNSINNRIPKRTKAQYYQDNRQKILKYMKETVICDICNKNITRTHIQRHIRNLHSV